MTIISFNQRAADGVIRKLTEMLVDGRAHAKYVVVEWRGSFWLQNEADPEDNWGAWDSAIEAMRWGYERPDGSVMASDIKLFGD